VQSRPPLWPATHTLLQTDATGNIDEPNKLTCIPWGKADVQPYAQSRCETKWNLHGYIDTCPFWLAFCLSAQCADVRQSLLIGQSPPMSRTILDCERQTVRKRQELRATRAALRVQVKISAHGLGSDRVSILNVQSLDARRC
jgi:hypothetical protein